MQSGTPKVTSRCAWLVRTQFLSNTMVGRIPNKGLGALDVRFVQLYTNNIQ